MTVEFKLNGQTFTALNGGPVFKFSEAVSLQVMCKTQAEVDYYWKKLSAGGDRRAQQCGWLKDKFGVSWQVVPEMLPGLVKDPMSKKAERGLCGDAHDEEARHRQAEKGLRWMDTPKGGRHANS